MPEEINSMSEEIQVQPIFEEFSLLEPDDLDAVNGGLAAATGEKCCGYYGSCTISSEDKFS